MKNVCLAQNSVPNCNVRTKGTQTVYILHVLVIFITESCDKSVK